MPTETSIKSKLDVIKDFYDTTYHKYSTPPRLISGHHRNLAERLALRPRQKVLDVACGTGEWLLATQQRGVIVNGVDISDKAIDACREAMPDAEFVVAPAEALPFPEQTFDIVTCLGALEHFVDAEAALAEMIRVGKPDARFVILVPNSGFLTRRLGLFRGTNQAMVKEEVLSLEEWRDMFEKAGLVVNQCWADLHVLSQAWIMSGSWYQWPIRFVQALMLLVWPLRWQYQVFYLCGKKIRL